MNDVQLLHHSVVVQLLLLLLIIINIIIVVINQFMAVFINHFHDFLTFIIILAECIIFLITIR